MILLIDIKLTHLYLASHKGTLSNSTEPVLTPQNVASDQGLHYATKKRKFYKTWWRKKKKTKKNTKTKKLTRYSSYWNEPAQRFKVEEFTRHKCVEVVCLCLRNAIYAKNIIFYKIDRWNPSLNSLVVVTRPNNYTPGLAVLRISRLILVMLN